MKTIKVIILLYICLFLNDIIKCQTEERLIYGPSFSTPELNNTLCGSNCECISDGKWCFRPTELYVSTPNPHWIFIGRPYIEVYEDNQGSAAWNCMDRKENIPSDRFRITLDNPTEKKARILSSSRSFKVRLVCLARYYP